MELTARGEGGGWETREGTGVLQGSEWEALAAQSGAQPSVEGGGTGSDLVLVTELSLDEGCEKEVKKDVYFGLQLSSKWGMLGAGACGERKSSVVVWD